METPQKSGSLKCVVVTPERAVLDVPCDFIAVPLYDGEMGFLPGRQPMIGRLGYGELRVVQGKTTRRFYVDGGFVQVRDDVVTLLTAKAVPAEELKVDAAQAALEAATKPTVTPAEQEAQTKAQLRARAQLRMARRSAEEEAGVH
jgi:F-type H+-transporting ATPase subunit epsilon